MKFVCDKCRTKYTIADEKVKGKVLKIRCKNCGNIIEVREPSARPTASPRAAKKPTTQGALRAASRHGGSRKRSSAVAKLGHGSLARGGPSKSSPAVGARADRSKKIPKAAARRPRPPAPPPAAARRGVPRPATPQAPSAQGNTDQTVVAAMPKELLRKFRQSEGTPPPSPAATPPGDEDGWFLGDDRGEYGPMTFAELAARCQRGEPGPHAEAWKEGYDDWRPLDEIPALKPYVKVAPPPRPVGSSKPAPASPYTKAPLKDAADAAPQAPSKAPLPAKVTTAPPPADSLVKIPMAVPVEAEPQWPELSPIQPSDPTPPPLTAAAALAPEPFAPAGDGPAPASDFAAAGAHVSPGASQSALNSQFVEIKRDRRPVYLIGAGVLILSVSVIVLVIYFISSGKKPTPKTDGATADSGMTMKPPEMRAATMLPPPMDVMAVMRPASDDSAEFDLDIDVSTGKVSRGTNMRRRPASMMAPTAMTTMGTMSSGSGVYGLPTMRPGFVGLMGFGTPSMTRVAASGGRPGDLRSVVTRNYNRLRRCYEKAARLNSRIKNPKLRITVKVRSSGKCRSVYVSPSRYQSNSLGICVRRTIMSWRWPSFGSDYTWAFSARFSSG